jgi:hypothetical protein
MKTIHITLAASTLIIVYILLACLDYHHFPYSDGAEHGAAVREIARDLLNPDEPMLNEYVDKSPRYVPSTVLMAAAVHLTGIDILVAIKIFSILFFLFFLFSVIFFAREYFQNPRQAVWSLACILFLWGTGWHGANAYMFSALVHTAWYPSLVSFACMFMALSCACRFLRNGGTASLLGWCLFGALAFVNHPPTALFLWIASILLSIEIRGMKGILRPWFAFAIGLSISTMVLWPYYDFFKNAFTVAGGSLAHSWDYRATRMYLYSDIILRTGPVLAAIPILCVSIIKRKHFMLTSLCLASLGIYAVGYFLRISLSERFIFCAVLSAQLLVSVCAYRLWQTVRTGVSTGIQTIGAILLAVLLVGGATGQAIISFNEYIRPGFSITRGAPFIRYHNPTAMHKRFADYIKTGRCRVLGCAHILGSPPVYWGENRFPVPYTTACQR